MKRLALAWAVFAGSVSFANHAFAFEHGHLFITNRGGNSVVELDANLTFVRTWFQGQSYQGSPLNGPNGIAFDLQDNLYVADTYNNRVVVFDRDGEFVRIINVAASLSANIETLNFDFEGRLYAAANPGQGTILRFAADGSNPNPLLSDPAFVNAGNINFTPEGDLLYSTFNTDGRGIRVLNRSNGQVLRTLAASDLGRVEDMAVDARGRIALSHYDANEIVILDAQGTVLRRLRHADLVQPTGVWISHDCNVIAASYGASSGRPQLVVFDFQGRHLRSVTVPGLAQTESLAIAGQILPGSFAEFPPLGYVSAGDCENFIASDGGLVFDGSIRDAASARDSASDASSPPGRADRPGDCACHMHKHSASSKGYTALIGLTLALMLARRWKRPGAGLSVGEFR